MVARQKGTGGSQAGPKRIDRHDPLIETVRGGPTLHEKGFFEWYVTFALPFAAESDGFIIQELYQESSMGAYEHFWECWRIRGGLRSPGDRIDGDHDDRYRKLRGAAPPDPSGWMRHTGVARFYPGQLPPEFVPDNPNVHFYMTRTQPSIWTGAGTRHDCYSEWGPGRNGLVAYAGNRELRRGTWVTFRPRGQ